MKFLSDYHTHTTYCDGKNSVGEMAERAYSLGFSALGLSGHGYTHFDESFCMSRENTERYLADIAKEKEKYKGKMEIFAGIEQDMYSKEDVSRFDYRIGSVHYLKIGEEYFPVDLAPEDMTHLINEYFCGDFELLAEHYYAEVSELFSHVDADIIGHIDLISKFRNRIPLTFGERYYNAAFRAIERLLPYGKPFEINVGAITRGYRTTPYPDPVLLKKICESGGDIILCGDCHSADRLSEHLEGARDLAIKCGFTKQTVLTKHGWEKIEL